MHLLLVEDEDAIRSALTRGLANHGTTVDAAATLAEARAKAATRRPDVLVTDLKLPDGLGLDLAQELGVPFVQMTGYGTFDDAVRAIRLGCVDFFTKPVSLRDLRRSLERVAGRVAASGDPLVIDPEGGVVLHVTGDRPETRPLAVASTAWASPLAAGDAWRSLSPSAPSRLHRQLLAELIRLVPAGRVVVNRDDRRWIAWLDTGDLIPDGRDFPEVREHLGHLARSVRWLADGGVLVEAPPEAQSPDLPACGQDDGWAGELLWPRELPPGEVIDLSVTSALGTWSYEWFRDHPGQAVVGARPDIRRQLESAHLPVLFRDPRAVGVTAQEKAELFG